MIQISSIVFTSIPSNRITAFVFTARGPAGKSGIGNLVVGESPSGTINGINKVFTSAVGFGSLWVYWNGIRQQSGTDYTITGANQITLASAPQVGDTLLIDYDPA